MNAAKACFLSKKKQQNKTKMSTDTVYELNKQEFCHQIFIPKTIQLHTPYSQLFETTHFLANAEPKEFPSLQMQAIHVQKVRSRDLKTKEFASTSA